MDRRSALKVLATGAACAGGVCSATRPTKASTPKTDPSKVVGMLYDTTKCIGCKACVVACSEANGLKADTGESGGLHQAPATLNASTKNLIKLYREGGDESYMKAQCMHCLDPACMSACMVGALRKDERGIVWWNGDWCVGCRYCQVACPFEVPKFEWESANPRIVKCEMCRHRLDAGLIPACCDVCPREAVIYGKREELLAEAHRRLTENPKTYVQKVYGEHDGGGTQVLYLAHVDFEKLGLPKLGDEPVPETVRNVQGTVYYGFLAPLALFGGLSMLIRRNHKKEQAAPAAPAPGGPHGRKEG